MTSELEHTLFLWFEGCFPKRIVYYLLIKGLIRSVDDLYKGRTIDPKFKINILHLVPGTGFQNANPDDPLPAGRSTPCLRIVNSTTKITRWATQSASIPLYLDEAYPELPSMQSTTALERIKMNDTLSILATASDDTKYYFRNAHPTAARLSKLPDEYRSLETARFSKMSMIKAFKEAQACAKDSLAPTGWLTPGLTHPGIVDTTLAADLRFPELGYQTILVEQDGLGPLKEWYARFKASMSWWDELEESGRFPEALVFGRALLEA